MVNLKLEPMFHSIQPGILFTLFELKLAVVNNFPFGLKDASIGPSPGSTKNGDPRIGLIIFASHGIAEIYITIKQLNTKI